MTYKMYVMNFQTAHFGSGKLETSQLTFSADRLYSALVLEALKMGKLDEFISLSQADDFVLSDAFPITTEPFLPKPIGYPKRVQEESDQDVKEMRRQAKLSKKLNYLSMSQFDVFLNGTVFENTKHAVEDVVTRNKPFSDGQLYQVGVTRFYDATSLYVIANDSKLLQELMTSLQFSGIGGKRSSGYGRFDLTIKDLPSELAEKVTTHHSGTVMTLTNALPVDSELEEAMSNGSYLLTKSSGFAFSAELSENYRKQDLYKFASGSTFVKTFKGSIVDVRPKDFPHAVWNYAKPLFLKLEV